MHHPTHHRAPRFGRPGAKLILILALSLALLLALIVGGLLLRSAVDPLARAETEARIARQEQVDQALGWFDVALAGAWRVLLYVAAPATALAIAWRQLGSRATLDDYGQARIKRAEAQRFPDSLQNLTFHDASKREADLEALAELLAGQAAPQMEPAAPQLPAASPGRPLLAELHSRGHVCRSGRSLLAGYSGGQGAYIELAECGFLGIGGQARSGKSTAAVSLICQAVLSDWHVFVADPHVHKDDGLLNRLRPLSGHLRRQAVTAEEIAALVRYVDKIGRARVNGDRDRTPVLLVIDEFTNLVWRELLPDDVLRILPSMAVEYAGVGVHGLIISHDYSKTALGGDLGAGLRRAFTHRAMFRMDAANAEFLLPPGSSALMRRASGLPTGEALLVGPEGASQAVQVAVPWLSGDDVRYAAQGRPEAPYAPWAPERLRAGTTGAHPAPTQPIPPRPVPATAPMVYTVQEQILDCLLGNRRWMTATEIASALGVDVKIVRTNLTPMERSRAIRRQAASRPGREQYEYSVNQSISQPLRPPAA